MRSISSNSEPGNVTCTVYNGTGSDIGAGMPVQWDPSNANPMAVKLPESPGQHAHFVGVTQSPLAAGTTDNSVVRSGVVYAKVLATATTVEGSWLFPTTVSGVTFFKESKTRTRISLREGISASSGSYVLAKVLLYNDANAPTFGNEGIQHDIWTAPAAASATAVHAAVTASDSAVTTVTTGFTNPDVPRNLTVTPGGTTADVAAMSVTITGTDAWGNALTEDFAFSANASTATTGSKAFKTVTSMSIPAQDGADATFAVGTGSKLGLCIPIIDTALIKAACLTGVLEGTAPTLTGSTLTALGAVSTSTATLNSALNGTQVDVKYYG